MATRRPRRSAERAFDIVLYGASGFVGRQTVAYLAGLPAGVRWALAGRSAARLEAVRAAAGPGAAGAAIIVADAHDAPALDALAAQASVVLSSAGPFALYGSTLVAACVRQRCHYVDITGETPWVRGLIDRHHAQAAADGTRIVPGCGFDSVPSDLGTWCVAQALWQRHGERCTSVKASFSLRGGLNGGTLASLLNVIDSGDKRLLDDPFLLNPAGTAPADIAPHADPRAPFHDADFAAWVGPFFMGPINTRVVRRSAALSGAIDADASPYAEGFRYQEYLRFGSGPLAALGAAGASAGSLAGQGLLKLKPARRLVERLAPAPGEGPSERSMDRGGFRCELIGTGERGSVQRGCVAQRRGDPGNRATSKMVCEAALALALDAERLPGAGRLGGVLTPATALGEVLAQRLRRAGMTVEP
jgi:short subunit dehydrogenase-like uncharacterized protein